MRSCSMRTIVSRSSVTLRGNDVFSTEQLVYPGSDGTVCQTKAFAGESTRLDCNSGFGSATMVTGTFGFVAASRVIRRIADNAGKKS